MTDHRPAETGLPYSSAHQSRPRPAELALTGPALPALRQVAGSLRLAAVALLVIAAAAVLGVLLLAYGVAR